MKKRVFYSEAAYFTGLIVLALGTSLIERASFGMSMVVAPAYLLHLKISPYLPFFTFGVAAYAFQALLLLLLAVFLRKVKKSYFLSFATAFLYGLILDAVMSLVAFLPDFGMAGRIALFAVGLGTSAVGIAFMFHTYFPTEAYELIVKEIAQKFNISIGKTKTAYDICSCTLAVILSLCFFGGFHGIHVGTLVCAALNGFLIGQVSRFLDKKFTFKDALPLREKMN